MNFFSGQQNYQYPQQNGYYTWNQPQSPVNTYQPNSAFGGVFPISGEEAAREYPPIRGTEILLMDTQSDVFYTKKADYNGNVTSFRIFDYSERTNESEGASAPTTAEEDKYVTKQELDNQFNRLKDFIEETVKSTKEKEVKKNERTV